MTTTTTTATTCDDDIRRTTTTTTTTTCDDNDNDVRRQRRRRRLQRQRRRRRRRRRTTYDDDNDDDDNDNDNDNDNDDDDDDDDAACRVRYIQKPDLERYTATYWGAWFRDARPPSTESELVGWSDKIWVSLHYRGSTVLEYASYDDYRYNSHAASVNSGGATANCRRPFHSASGVTRRCAAYTTSRNQSEIT